MQESIFFSTLTLVTSAFANTEAQKCTITVVEPDLGCCVAPAAETVTSIDCHGCAIQTNPGPHCDLICETTQTIPTSTRTHTVCKVSATPTPAAANIITTLATHLKPRMDATAVEKQCTTTFHDTNTGCCGLRPAKTATETIDCNGCVGVNIPAPHCDIACEATITNPLFTSTKTVCAVGASRT